MHADPMAGQAIAIGAGIIIDAWSVRPLDGFRTMEPCSRQSPPRPRRLKCTCDHTFLRNEHVSCRIVRRGKSSEVRELPLTTWDRNANMTKASLRAVLEVAFAEKKGPWGNVALTKQGKPWGESGLNQVFQRARDRAGREGWSYHDLRHFFISELLPQGRPRPRRALPGSSRRFVHHATLRRSRRQRASVMPSTFWMAMAPGQPIGAERLSHSGPNSLMFVRPSGRLARPGSASGA